MTIAPVIPEWQPDFASLEKPVRFGDSVTFELLPDWCRTAPMLDNLSLIARERIRDDVSYALVSSYEGGEAIGERHPSTIGGTSRSRQSVARESLNMAAVAMWIALPTGFSYQVIIDASERDGAWRARAVSTYEPFLPHGWNVLRSHNHDDMATAVELYGAIGGLNRSSAIWTALRILLSSLAEPEYIVRYLLTWVALEALLGPQGGGELRFRIAQRLSFFLSSSRVDARERFAALKDAYNLRSKIVHGGRPPRLSGDEAMSMLKLSEESLRESLLRVLSDEALTSAFSAEKTREQLLDSLVFTGSGGAI